MAQLCKVTRNSDTYDVTGGAPATGGNFAEVSDFIRLEFVSLSHCDAQLHVDIVAPNVSILTGIDQGDVNLTNAQVIAFATAATAVLLDAKYPGVTDFTLASGVRNRIARERAHRR